MKILLLLCIVAHFAAATPPFFGSGGLLSGGGLLGSLGGLFGAGSNTETDIDEDGASIDTSAGSSAGSSSSGGGSIVGRQFLGDVLGVKIGLLSSLRNVVSPQEVGFENGAAVETESGHVDGTGAGISGFNGGSQMYSSGSGFSQFGSGASETSGASAYTGGESAGAYSQGSYAGQGQGNGYNYNSGAASSGYAGNGGYVYNRPQPAAPVVANALSSGNSFVPSQRFDSGGFTGGSFETQQFNTGNSGSEFSSGSATLESNGGSSFGSTSSGSATRSGTAGLGGGSSGIGSLVSAGVQVPIQLLTAYRNGINRGFDSVTSGVSLLQRILGGLGGDSNSIDSK